MKLKKLYLNDFGIFRNQAFLDLAPGLVVIAGPNRAGKTTLMQALRYLGYGLPGNLGLPAAAQYDLEAEVEYQGDLYNLDLKGLARPRLYPAGGAPQISLEELFARLDGFSYRQLFTISLDELRQTPAGLEGEEQRRLGAVLLGGGWSDALVLTKHKTSLAKKADSLGGKYGDPGVKELKPYYRQLAEGLAELNEANAQLKQYEAAQRELDTLKTVLLPELKAQLGERENAIAHLELLSDHYASYEEYRRLTAELEDSNNRELLNRYPPGGLERALDLKEEYNRVLDQYALKEDEFKRAAGGGGQDLKDRVLAGAREIQTCLANLSGLKQRLKNAGALRQRLDGELAAWQEELWQIFPAWAEDPGRLMQVTVHQVEADGLEAKVSRFQEAKQDLKRHQDELKDHEGRLKEKQKLLATLNPAAGDYLKKALAGLGADLLLIVLLAAAVDYRVSVVAGTVVALGVLLWYTWQNGQFREEKVRRKTLAYELAELEERHKILAERVAEEASALKVLEDELSAFKDRKGLPEELLPERLPAFLETVRRWQRTYSALEKQRLELEQEETELTAALGELAGILKPLGLFPGEPAGAQDATELFTALEKAQEYLGLARELQQAQNLKEQKETEILNLLNLENPLSPEELPQSPAETKLKLEAFMDRGQKAKRLEAVQVRLQELRAGLLTALNTPNNRQLLGLSKEGQPDDMLAAFGRQLTAYGSLAELREKAGRVEEEVSVMEEEITQKQARMVELQTEINRLASTEKLEKAQDKINQSRAALDNLARQYAAYRLAAFMLDRVQQRLLAETRDYLLAPANQLFAELTGGDYQEIEPSTGQVTEFTAVMPGGHRQGVEALSRATAEQLFFAVRLSRIREIKPEPPVILDDTLVNFDPRHSRMALNFLAELAQTHQIFLLTCHPEFVTSLIDCGIPAQFWSLDRGRIDGPLTNERELCQLLG